MGEEGMNGKRSKATQFGDHRFARSHHRMYTSLVIPGRRASVEPGIHSHRLWLWIPGLRLAAHSGMTAREGACISAFAGPAVDLWKRRSVVSPRRFRTFAFRI